MKVFDFDLLTYYLDRNWSKLVDIYRDNKPAD